LRQPTTWLRPATSARSELRVVVLDASAGVEIALWTAEGSSPVQLELRVAPGAVTIRLQTADGQDTVTPTRGLAVLLPVARELPAGGADRHRQHRPLGVNRQLTPWW
jgi:uncharacterized protein GlcG (DUF336 family)